MTIPSATMNMSEVNAVLKSYFVDHDRSENTVEHVEPQLDADMGMVDSVLEMTAPHDPDFVVFRHFTDPHTTILDIGANAGYSATSMWIAGAMSSVACFEPIKAFGPILAELGRRQNQLVVDKGGARRFESYMLGISDAEGEIEFAAAVVNGRIVSPLTTADKNPDLHPLVENIRYYVDNYVPGGVRSFKIPPFTSSVTTIDKWMRSGQSGLNLDRVVAIKVDTEGYEGHVLVGAGDLLSSQKPLILAERGHVITLARETALQHGYVLAERNGDQLYVSNEITTRVNGFFIHPAHFEQYRQSGLLGHAP